MITNTELAYAAGYIDGDGCFNISKYLRKYRAYIIISSTNKNVLDWFKENFGGGISSPKKIILGRERHKPVYYFVMAKKQGVVFTKSIIRFLVEKSEEAKVFIAYCGSINHEERLEYIDKINTLKNSINLVSKNLMEEFLRSKNTINPTEEDFAYFAGFIDAECCFYIAKYRPKNRPNDTYKISLSCNNSKTPIFKWLLQRFGGSIRFINRNSKDPKQRDQLVWSISCRALANIINRIHPFLKHKKPVCEELIKFYATTIPRYKVARKTEEFRRSYAKILEERERIVHEVHRLNKKGI
jgi:hypothetical protein